MKEAILRLLKDRKPEYVSGEEICRNFNVTRSAVWKQVKLLQQAGYVIDARPRLGYRLDSVPDRLYPEEIQFGLATRFIGREISYHDAVSSTTAIARELALAGAPAGTLVVAEEQTGGRGRMDRGWHSPARRGIYFSLLLRPPVSPAEAARVTMLTGVALAGAIEQVAGLTPGIKWPNDLLAGGKKLCGILTEMSAEMDRINHLVVSAGINCNLAQDGFPPELRDLATSLLAETGRPVNRVALLQACLAGFERWYDTWLGRGFAPVLARWKEMAVTLNRPVLLSTPHNSWEGWAEDVDEDGALLLRLPGGQVQRFVSGEVSLRI